MFNSLDEYKKSIQKLCIYYKEVSSYNDEYKQDYDTCLNIFNDINKLSSFSELENYMSKLNNEDNNIISEIYVRFEPFGRLESLKKKIYLAIKSIKSRYPNINKKDINKAKFMISVFNDICYCDIESINDYFNNLKSNLSKYNLEEKKIVYELLRMYKECYPSKNISTLYNENLANSITKIKNIDFSKKIKIILPKRTKSLSDPNYSIFYNDILFCKEIDHKVTMDMVNDNKLNEWEIDYLTQINNQMVSDPYLFLALPLSNLSISTLKKYSEYMPNIEEVYNRASMIYKQAIFLNNRYVNKEKLSEEEENKLFKFLDYYISKNRLDRDFDYELYVYYLMNKESTLSFHESSFLTKYLGYKKCADENIENIDISFCRYDKNILYEASDTCGLYSNGIVTINKRLLKDCVINEEEKTTLYVLKVLFHELRHALQEKEKNDKTNSQLCYDDIIFNIINRYNMKDYDINYSEYYNELDANKASYDAVLEILLRYRNNDEINMLWAHDRANSNANREMFTNRKRKSMFKKIIRPTAIHEKEYTDRFFSKNPKKLEDFPLFKQLYDEKGNPYDLDTFLSIYHKGKQQYYYNFFAALIYEGQIINKESIENKTNVDKINIIRNMCNLFSILLDRLFISREIIYNDDSIKEYGNKKIICDNILIDIKIGKKIMLWYKNILEDSKELENIISKLDKNLLDNYNNDCIWFDRIVREFEEKGVVLKGNAINIVYSLFNTIK